MRPPIRDVDKNVKILSQQLGRIGFQVSLFVVIREARSDNCGPRGDGV